MSKQVHGAFTTLTESDRRALNDAIGKLFEADTANVGATSDWSNPETGRNGTVTVTRYFDKADMHCRALKFESNSPKSKKPSVFRSNICKLPSGERKFL